MSQQTTMNQDDSMNFFTGILKAILPKPAPAPLGITGKCMKYGEDYDFCDAPPSPPTTTTTTPSPFKLAKSKYVWIFV